MCDKKCDSCGAAPQPPSVGGEPEVMAFLHSSDGYMNERWVDLRRDNTCNHRELILRDHHRYAVTARDQQLAELKEAFEESQEELVSRGKQLAAQAKENEALRARVAELEELRKDAERYRWLCDGNGYFMEENSLCGHDNDKEEADAEIDAAMAKQVTKDDQ